MREDKQAQQLYRTAALSRTLSKNLYLTEVQRYLAEICHDF